MTVDDSEMQRLWKLTNELTAQLVFNRSATLELKQQLAELQTRTLQGPAPVLGANGNIQDYRLRIENERLQEENNQLHEQVREYERWMEYIMSKFRLQNFAMAQTRKESMQEARKMAEQGGEAVVRLQEENAALQARLVDLGAVARRVMQEEYYSTESLIESLESENQNLREMLGVAKVSDGAGPHNDNMEQHLNNRVSLPSTDAGSHVASSESEPDQPQSPLQEHGRSPGLEQRRALQEIHRNRGRDIAGSQLALPPKALTVETGVRAVPSTIPGVRALSPRSPVSPRSTSSPTSPSWSSSTSASSSLLSSPTRMDPSIMRFKTMSPPLEDTEVRAHGEFGPNTGGHQSMARLGSRLGSSPSVPRDI
ncbi:hypothetical protein EMPS_02215 [Entomortierella parvispora]|uniref:Uncharacterized protein n=1 Tax=Entomortierella parvispora TaxID=205924 RepID=A0A9P3LT97_9FUNG|nr:hypothetical protein EMPS_02215 [Entomortierella parvispora]